MSQNMIVLIDVGAFDDCKALSLLQHPATVMTGYQPTVMTGGPALIRVAALILTFASSKDCACFSSHLNV